MRSSRLLIVLRVLSIPVAFVAGRSSVAPETSADVAKAVATLASSGPTRSDPTRSGPIQSGPIQSGPKPKIKDAVADRIEKIAESAPERYRNHARPDARVSAAAETTMPQPPPAPPPADVTAAAVPAEKLLSDMLDKTKAGVFVSEISQGHDLTQKEQVDPDWGPRSNQEISDLVQSQFGDRFDVPTIDCRTDICEIMAATKNGSADGDMQDFQRLTYLLSQQPWFADSGFDIDNAPIAVGSIPPDKRTLFIMYITRK